MCAIYNLITIEPNMTRFFCPERFDLQLENFGVDTSELKKKAPMREFRGWLEDWEKPLLKKKDVVAETRLLEKYKDLKFDDPDEEGVTFNIYAGNLEWQKGRDGGWGVIAEKSEDSDEDQPFCIDDMLIGMILDTEQADEVKVVRPPNESS